MYDRNWGRTLKSSDFGGSTICRLIKHLSHLCFLQKHGLSSLESSLESQICWEKVNIFVVVHIIPLDH